jgi:tetratricopeptide (TPR) repeat protein
MAPGPLLAAKPAVWIEVRSPNFIVITNGSEKQARKVAYQFETFRSVLRTFFNVKGPATDPPMTIIAAKDEESLKPLEPVVDLAKGSAHLAGLFLDGPEKKYILLRLDVSVDEEASEPFETIYHEYVHYFTRRIIPNLPLWLSEGLAEFYGNTRLEGNYAVVGTASSTNFAILQHSPILPLSTLYAVDASSPYYHEENKASLFYAESWALTHYLMEMDWRDKTNRIQQFVILLAKNTPPDEASKRIFGDPKSLESALNAYIYKFAILAAHVNITDKIDEHTFALEPLSEAESLAARGDLLVRVNRLDDAQKMLAQAISIDPKLAASYESMGFLYSRQKKFEEANKWFSQAVSLNSQSAIANFLYATNLFKTGLDNDAAAQAETCLRTAIHTDPGFAPAYDALAYLLLTHQRADEARLFALDAVAMEPGNVYYRLTMVSVLEHLNLFDDAVRVSTLALNMARSVPERSRAEYVLDHARRMQGNYASYQDASRGIARKQEAGSFEGPEVVSSDHPGTTLGPGQDDDPGPPQLRHRDVYTLQAENKPAAPLERPELLPQSEAVEGTITEVTCVGTKTLELTLASKADNRQLYSDNCLDVAFNAMNYQPKDMMNPCTDLKGLHARIIYHPAKGIPDQGQIVEVQLSR